MAERTEKTMYYFRRKKGDPDINILMRRISHGKNVISYQAIGEFSNQEKDRLRVFRKKVHRKRVTEMDRNMAGQYSIASIYDSLRDL